RFVALQRAPRRALAAPAKLFEEPPDVARMVAYTARLLDQLPDPPRGPELCVEAERFGAPLQAAFDLAHLHRRQHRLATRAPRESQTRPTADEELPSPAVHRLAMHTDLARDFRLAHALLEQRRCAQPPRLERCKIPPHPRRIPHAGRIARYHANVTIL